VCRARALSTRPSRCWASWRPRQMVFRLRPVISITRWMPPCPHCWANIPAQRRRFFSLNVNITRFIARCSWAMPL
jgi:hypothetical protein